MKIQYQLLFLSLFFSIAIPMGSLAQNSAAVKKVVPITQKKVATWLKVATPTKTATVLAPPLQAKMDSFTIADEKLISPASDLLPLYTINAGPITQDVLMVTKTVDFSHADYLFYLLVAMFLLLASVRAGFPKYFSDLFGLFSHSTFKQKSIREQLSQSALPSLLLNILFFFSAGFFLCFITGYYQMQMADTFEGNLGIWVIVLISVYVSKMLVIKLLGWVFQMEEACQIYNFIIFMMNKVLGVILLPFLLLLCFGPASWRPSVVIISLFFIAAFFLYRYIIAYPSLRPSVRLNRFHFFIYLCSFEILPLAIIYKEIAVRFLQTT